MVLTSNLECTLYALTQIRKSRNFPDFQIFPRFFPDFPDFRFYGDFGQTGLKILFFFPSDIMTDRLVLTVGHDRCGVLVINA